MLMAQIARWPRQPVACTPSTRRAGTTICIWLALLAAVPTHAEEAKPKLGRDAVSILESHEYLQSHAAPDYWILSPYYASQITRSACSLATIAMVVNALRGLPASDDDPVVTQEALLRAVGSPEWVRETQDGGRGVTWSELERYLRAGLEAYRLDASIEAFRPHDRSDASLEQARGMLLANEQSAEDIVVVYFNQGTLTGSWDGPHISPIGAYDADLRRVLIMDVDREWYIPYWTSDLKLLDAMVRPAPAKWGALGGETGGLIRVSMKSRSPAPPATPTRSIERPAPQ